MLLLEFELELFDESLLSLLDEFDVELDPELLILHPMTHAMSNAKPKTKTGRDSLFINPPCFVERNCAAYIDLACACQRFNQ